MYILKLSLFLTTLILAYALPKSSENDKETLQNILECVRQKMPDGVPEIGYPSHNPMYYEYNYTFGIQVVVLKKIFTVFDCNYYGVPDFEISLTQNSEDSAEDAEFSYEIKWPQVFIDAKWSDVTDTNGTDVETSGKMNMTLSDPLWRGSVKIRKPFLSGIIEEFKVDFNSVSNAEVGVTNFDEVQTFIFSNLFKYVWIGIFDSRIFGDYLQQALKAHFQDEWLSQPERFAKLLEGCTI